MASYANKTAFIRHVTKRGFAAQSKPAPAAGGSAGIKSKQLSNKMVLATANSSLPVSRVSIVFRAGSRYEDYENMGASHMLRICAGLSTKNSSGFAITRNIQQCGGNIHVTSDREIIQYTVEVNNEHMEKGLRYLKDVATAPAFKPWELSESAQRLRVQVASVPKNVRAVELLHKAAFGSGLGNSIYCPKYHIGKLSPETMQLFFNNTCTIDRCSVVGVGVDENVLSGFAQNLQLESGEGKSVESKFRGGVEIRKDRASQMAHIAIGGEGAGLNNMKDALTFAVLKLALGSEPTIKRGNMAGPLGKIADGAGGKSMSVSAFNAMYSDTGLFGVVISCDGSIADQAVQEAVKILKCGAVSAADVNRGKALLKRHLLSLQGSENHLIADMGYQAALLGNVQTAADLNAIVDGLSENDVKEVVKKLQSLSMAAVGNLAKVPSIADIK